MFQDSHKQEYSAWYPKHDKRIVPWENPKHNLGIFILSIQLNVTLEWTPEAGDNVPDSKGPRIDVD